MAPSTMLQPGSPTKSACSSLGMLGDNFYIFRSFNAHPNTQFIMEAPRDGVEGNVLPQLLQYLDSLRKEASITHNRRWSPFPPLPPSIEPPLFHEQAEFALAQFGETVVQSWMLSRGYVVFAFFQVFDVIFVLYLLIHLRLLIL
ncbi:hypothetical protein B0H14DRAFT_3474175 [Mycena olivaceomarginata]|nr:hypothetical protein B0H14DRAFT_3474175 [Mycena olivaceomarginata]